MRITRRNLLLRAAGASVFGPPLLGLPQAVSQTSPSSTITQPPHPSSSTQSTLEHASCPEWFRDAKFGIWAHWGPTSAIGEGDWYARNMYIEGSRQNRYHVATYGPPSKVGYKDTIPLWKAERFDPPALIRLYADAGAKYFVSMGVHCDNFDLWNSRHHRWNSVRMGPQRDIVGEWRAAARARGLRFGVSEHVWASYNWWTTNKGADAHGPYAGVPYDGNNPADFDLYFPPHAPGPEAWAEQGNESEAWKREWFSRAQDLIDQHQPDLYYEDGPIPFGDWGRSLVAHFYRQSLQRSGKVDVVYTAKRRSECAAGGCTLDIERGVADAIEPLPFQTDTCLGDWHYKRGITYKSAKTVIDLLVDVVSRNGNLLLNIPLPGSGMPDEDELRILSEITKWMTIHSAGIHGTRPWKIFGEGPASTRSSAEGGMNGTPEHFNEKERHDLTGADIRFTTKAGALYAFTMGSSSQDIRIRALSPRRALEPRRIAQIELLGSSERLLWKLDDEGVLIRCPTQWPSPLAVAFKIQFER